MPYYELVIYQLVLKVSTNLYKAKMVGITRLRKQPRLYRSSVVICFQKFL